MAPAKRRVVIERPGDQLDLPLPHTDTDAGHLARHECPWTRIDDDLRSSGRAAGTNRLARMRGRIGQRRMSSHYTMPQALRGENRMIDFLPQAAMTTVGRPDQAVRRVRGPVDCSGSGSRARRASRQRSSARSGQVYSAARRRPGWSHPRPVLPAACQLVRPPVEPPPTDTCFSPSGGM